MNTTLATDGIQEFSVVHVYNTPYLVGWVLQCIMITVPINTLKHTIVCKWYFLILINVSSDQLFLHNIRMCWPSTSSICLVHFPHNCVFSYIFVHNFIVRRLHTIVGIVDKLKSCFAIAKIMCKHCTQLKRTILCEWYFLILINVSIMPKLFLHNIRTCCMAFNQQYLYGPLPT